MELDTEFVRLPLRFDADRLAAEVAAVLESTWLPHPQGFRGNSALLLICADGDPRNDSLVGHMRPAPVLDACPYLRQVLATFRSRLGRTRLMRIDAHEEVTPHTDRHYYWRRHLRLHVPIVTDPSVQFACGGQHLHMAAGSCWTFDTWRSHHVQNPSGLRRIHLVADTTGSPWLWDRIDMGERPFAAHAATTARRMPEQDVLVPFDAGAAPVLETEGASMPVVMSPVELGDHIAFLCAQLRQAGAVEAADRLQPLLGRFRARWQSLWMRHAASSAGWPHYRKLLDVLSKDLKRIPPGWELPNGTSAAEALDHWIVRAALHPELATDAHRASPGTQRAGVAPRYERPVFIVAAPRSGSTLLFETLARSPTLWTVGGESHQVIEGIPALAPAAHGWASNALDAADATEAVVQSLHERFAAVLRDRDGLPWSERQPVVRLLEKTPKNALRIPFLARAFPGARFVYLVREPRGNVSSILEAWRSGEFVTYERLPEWQGGRWSLLLVPNWRALQGQSLAAVAAAQYRAAHAAIMAGLAALPQELWCAVSYEALLADPRGEVARVSAFLDIDWDTPPPQALPWSAVTVTAPDPGKWRVNAAALAPHLEAIDAAASEVARFTGLTVATDTAAKGHALAHSAEPAQDAPPPPSVAAAPTARAAADDASAAAAAPPSAAAHALGSVHTRSLVQVLEKAGLSLAVSTYQAGKLVLVRQNGEVVDTNFKPLRKPMGLALRDNVLAVGTASEVHWYHDVPAAAPAMEPRGRVDACFMPRASHVTGNIDIHEMAFAGSELWVVNTRFCCLCTLDAQNSFTPRWKPPFVSALAAEDRCHLNGLAVADGRVRYVTALGQTDSAGGWRADKAAGGVLIEVDSGRIVADRLSMPHSPRWYRGKLWVLESGNGALCTIDPVSGAKHTVCELPGFTRGLDFHGPLAFIGLSQVRESAVFAGLPLTERLVERSCGVWVVNIVSGEVVGFLRFEEAVQEVFAVAVLPGRRFPELVLAGEAPVADTFVLPPEALRQVPQAAGA